MEEAPKKTTKEEDELINKMIQKYETELKNLKSYKFTYTNTDYGSRVIIFTLITIWTILSLSLNLQKSIVGIAILFFGIFYSLLLLFKKLLIPSMNNNFSFLLIGLPLYIWLDRRYSGDVEYVARILFSTGIFASASMIEYPLDYEKSGLIRNITTVYTVLLFLYVLYDLSINIKQINPLPSDSQDIPPIF